MNESNNNQNGCGLIIGILIAVSLVLSIITSIVADVNLLGFLFDL